jgi:vesicle coat complex subunit
MLAVIVAVAVLLLAGWRVAFGPAHAAATYKGKPASYWRMSVKDWEALRKAIRVGPCCKLIVTPPPPPPPTLWDRLKDFVARLEPSKILVLPPSGDDPEALPVLMELLQDEDGEVRAYAAIEVGMAGPSAREAVPLLAGLLKDADPEVRRAALVALTGIDPRPAAAVPVLAAMLKDQAAIVRRRAANRAAELGPAVAAVAPALRDALADPDGQVRVEAAAALTKIEGQEP